MKRHLLFVCMLGFSVWPVSADLVVSPDLGRQGNVGGASPFLLSSDLAPSERWQQVYSANDFDGISMLPALITELSFAARPASRPIDVNLQNIQINLSTTPRDPDRLSNTFADNIGVDDTIVFSGVLHFVDTGLEQFGIHVQLQQPFVYDHQAGNLLVDIRNYITIPPPPSGIYSLDGEATFGDSVSVVAGDVNATSGFVGTGGLVTRFTVIPVPEPKTFLLLVLAILMFGLFDSKRLVLALKRFVPQKVEK